MARKPKSARDHDEFPIPNFKAAKQEAAKIDVEAQKTRLKSLINLGKERGFLTYAEINDHLPDMVDADQIEAIIEMKINLKLRNFPLRLKENNEIKDIFFNLIDDRAKSIISKRVSKMNGDVRVAFDIIKSSITELFKKIRESTTEVPKNQVVVTMDMVLKVFNDKYGSKIPETLRALPR